MEENEVVRAVIAFVHADIAYLKLLEDAVDTRTGTTKGISDSERGALQDARKRKAALEDQMYCLWEILDRAAAIERHTEPPQPGNSAFRF